MQQGKSNYSLAICSMQCFMWLFTLLFNKTMRTCIAARRSGDSHSSKRCQVLYLLEETHSPMCNEKASDFLKWFNIKLNSALNWVSIDVNKHKIGCTRVLFAFVQLPLTYYKLRDASLLGWSGIFSLKKNWLKNLACFLLMQKKSRIFFW